MDRTPLQLSDFQVQHAAHPSCTREQVHSASACGALALLMALMRLELDKAMTDEQLLDAYNLRERPKKRH